MSTLKKYWPSISAAILMVVPYVIPSLLTYIKSHPHTFLAALCTAVIAAYHAKAPKDMP